MLVDGLFHEEGVRVAAIEHVFVSLVVQGFS